MILAAAGTSGSAYLVKPVLDKIFVNKDLHALHILPFLIILVYLMQGVGRYVQSYYFTYIGEDIIRRIRDRMLRTILGQDMQFFHNFRSGELVSRNINDIALIQEFVSTMIPEMGRQMLTALGLLGVVIYQSPKLAFLALVGFPLTIVPLVMIARRIKKLSHKSQAKTSDITARLNEIFHNIEMIKARNTEDFEYRKFSRENRDFFDLTMKTVKTAQLTSPLMEVLGAIGVALVIAIGGKAVILGEMSMGSFFSFMTALFMLYTPIKKITSIFNRLQIALAASERIIELLDHRPTVVAQGDRILSEGEVLEFRDVKLRYGDKEALKGVTFTVRKGETLALVGDSGGGKSSIVNLIVRFFDPDEGEIRIDGAVLPEYRLESLREGISLVTQQVYIFNDTVAANVAYGKEIDEERVIRALREADAWEFIREMGGIHTPLREHGSNLSGGQKQRIAIARALYTDPKIIIFDEATSALDTRSEKRIVEAIERIGKDRITIVIAHRLSTIRRADSVAVLKEGRVLCKGPEERLRRECEEYRRLLEA